MAVNKKGKSRVNSRFSLPDLERILEQNERESSTFADLKHATKEAYARKAFINKMEEEMPGASDPIQVQRVVYQANKKIRQMQTYQETKQEQFNAQAMNVVNRDFSQSSVNSQILQSINAPNMQTAGLQMASQGSFASLTTQRQEILERMNTVRGRAERAAGHLVSLTPATEGDFAKRVPNTAAQNTIAAASKEMEELTKRLTMNQAGITELKRQGLDPQSRFSSLTRNSGKAYDVLGERDLQAELASGKGLGALSPQQLREKEIAASEKVIKAMDDLRASFGKGEVVVEQFTKAAEEAQAELDKVQKAQSMGGGGKGSGQAWASVVAQAANLIGNTIQTMAIDQPLQSMQNATGYANLENRKYDMWHAAIAGDMSARLELGGVANAQQFGKDLRERMHWVQGSRLVGAAATTTVGALQAGDAIASAPGGTVASKFLGNAQTVQNIAGGVQAAGEGISQGLIVGKDMYQHISDSAVELQGNLAAMDFNKASSHIPGSQLQAYRNHILGMGAAAREMGAGVGGKFIDETGSAAFMERMIGVGLSSEQAAKLAQYGASTMGSTFSAGDLIRAKHLENWGMGTAEENLQRQAIFSQAGSQNPSQTLAKVLAQGVAEGFNNSKQLNLIAENTGQMVEQAASRGSQYDVGDIAAKMLTAAIDKSNPNKEFAITQQAAGMKSIETMLTDTSTSIPNMIGVARLQKDLDINQTTATVLTKTPTALVQKWRQQVKEGHADDVKIDMLMQGMDVRHSKVFAKDPNAFFDTATTDTVLKEVAASGMGWATGATDKWAKLQKWISEDPANRKGVLRGDIEAVKKAPEDIQTIIGLLGLNASLGGMGNGNAGVYTRDLGMRTGVLTASEAGPLPQEGTNPVSQLSFTQQEAAAGANQSLKAGEEGISRYLGKNFNGTTGSMFIRGTGTTAEGAAGPNGEKTFADNVGKMGEAATNLNQASGALTVAAQKIAESAGVNKLTQETLSQLNSTMKDLKPLMEKMGGKSTPPPPPPSGAARQRADGKTE